MPIEVETKDCTALSDAEISEIADLCADAGNGLEIGILSKQREAWVLITRARSDDGLGGFAFSTLERIGGTPCVLVGCAAVARTDERDILLRGLIGDMLYRAVLAFPDEDVLVGTRFVDAAGFDAYRGLVDIVPRPDHKATGEERAWGRRLVKRFSAPGTYDDRAFRITGDGDAPACALDHEHGKGDSADADVTALFKGLDRARGDALVAFGWAMAEDLDAIATAR